MRARVARRDLASDAMGLFVVLFALLTLLAMPSTALGRDRTAPRTVANVGSAWSNVGTVRLVANDNRKGAGVKHIYYRLGSGRTRTYTRPFAVPEGSTRIKYWAVDKAKNTERAHILVLAIDRKAPVSSAAPLPVGWVASPQLLVLSAIDGRSGVSATYYRIGTKAPARYTGPVTISSDGATRIHYWSKDAAGNVEAPKSCTVRIDSGPPSTAILGAPTSSVAGGPVRLTLHAADAGIGVARTYYSVNGADAQLYAADQRGIVVASPGVSSVAAWSVDALGQTEQLEVATFSISYFDTSRNPGCVGCHTSTSVPAAVTVDFRVGAVDRSAACPKCHPAFLVGTHPYHNANANCGAICHLGWGAALVSAQPSVVTSFGAFAAGSSAVLSSDQLHIIHSQARWPAGLDYPDSRCASCHAAAACIACHESTDYPVTAGHAAHSASGDTSYTAQPHITRTVGFGVPAGNMSVLTAQTQSEQCSTPACHNTAGLAAFNATLYDDFSHAADTATSRGANTVTVNGSWRTAYGMLYSGGRMVYSSHAGDTFALTLTGRVLGWVSVTGPDKGIADVYVDGAKVATVDCYSAAAASVQTVWTSASLAAGSHTVTVTVTGTRNPASSGTQVAVDEFCAWQNVAGKVAPLCTDCHPDKAASHGYDAVKHAASVGASIESTSGLTCGACHSTDLFAEHQRAGASSASAGCANCHPDPRDTFTSWNHTCSQVGCHPANSSNAAHAGYTAAHVLPVSTPGSCFMTGCHATPVDVVSIHSHASTTTAGITRTSCTVCHSATTMPQTTDCASCHDLSAGHLAIHDTTVDATCTGSGCHVGANLVSIHTKSSCSTCHASGRNDVTTAIAGHHKNCSACHTNPDHTALHGSSETCFGSCHTAQLDTTAHVPSCATCHSSADPSVVSAISSGSTDCASCHSPADQYLDANGNAYVLVGAQHDAVPPVISAITTSYANPTTPTVSWSTDKPASSWIDYGPTASYGASSGVGTLVTSHTVAFPAASGTTHFRIRTVDAMGNQSVSGDYACTVSSVALTSAVKVTGGKFAGNPATVTWTTLGPCDGWVDYGLTASYGSTVGTSVASTGHSVTLPILSTAVYHFRVRSTAGTDTYQSADTTFSSNSTLTQTAPVLSTPAPGGGGLQFTWTSPNALYGPFTYSVHIWRVSGVFAGTFDKTYSVTGTNLLTLTAPQSQNGGGLLASSTTYNWTVSATDKDGDTYPISSAGTFTYTNPASCPILYTWDGTKYDFITDVMGRGVLGIQVAPGQYRFPPAVEDSRIDASLLKADGGVFKMMLKNEKDEIEYVDNLKLKAIDHPIGTQVYLDDLTKTFDTRGLGDAAIFTVNDPKPVRATYSNDPIYSHGTPVAEKDITSEVATIDAVSPPASLFDDNRYTFDLGDLHGAPNIKLVMSAWSAYASPGERQAWLNAGAPSADMRLEVADADGTWVPIDSDLPFVPGLTKTVVLDLSGKFPAGVTDYKVRMRGLTRTFFDYVAVDTSAPKPVTVTEVDASRAELSFKGVARSTYDPLPGYDYDTPDTSFLTTHNGNFTKFGDVLPLLTAADDKYVIMDTGDQIELQFPDVPLAPGMERTYVIHTDGYFQEITGNVDPLPFHGMSNFPYPASEQYPTDQDHQDYLREWNTRVHSSAVSSLDVHDQLTGALTSISDVWGKVRTGSERLIAALFPAEKPASSVMVASATPVRMHYSINTDRIALNLAGASGAITTVTAPSQGWESQTASGTMPTPTSPGSSVTTATLQQASSQDAVYWITNLAATNRSFNWQIAKFQVAPALKSSITGVGVAWIGHGDPTAGFPTVLYIWNFKTLQWDMLGNAQTQLNANLSMSTVQATKLHQAECLRCHSAFPRGGVSMPATTTVIGDKWIGSGADFHGGAGSAAPLDCTACHAPHQGSSKYFMASKINGVTIPKITTSNQMQLACAPCHGSDVYADHQSCNDCHNDSDAHTSNPTIDGGADCLSCHGHGQGFQHVDTCHCGASGAYWQTF